MKRLLLNSIIIIVSLLIIDSLFGLFLDKKFSLKYSNKASVAYNNNYDLALMGASEMYNQYVSSIIADSLNISTYNYGAGGQNIYYQYSLLNLMINHATPPKWILLELNEVDFYNMPKWNTEKLDVLYPMYDLDDSLRSIVNLQGWREEALLRIFRCYKHNSNILNYLRAEFLPQNNKDHYLGYSPIDPVEFLDELEVVDEHTEDYLFDEQKEDYLRRFIDLCKKNHIKLIVVNAPYYEIHGKIAWMEKLEELLDEENIPYLNFDNDSRFTNHREWYYNRVHFNKIGAVEYTKKIIPELRNVIN